VTITELLNLPTKDLEALTDEQLQAHLVKFFPYSRPKNAFNIEDFAAGENKDKIKDLMAKLEAADKAKPKIKIPSLK